MADEVVFVVGSAADCLSLVDCVVSAGAVLAFGMALMAGDAAVMVVPGAFGVGCCAGLFVAVSVCGFRCCGLGSCFGGGGGSAMG